MTRIDMGSWVFARFAVLLLMPMMACKSTRGTGDGGANISADERTKAFQSDAYFTVIACDRNDEKAAYLSILSKLDLATLSGSWSVVEEVGERWEKAEVGSECRAWSVEKTRFLSALVAWNGSSPPLVFDSLASEWNSRREYFEYEARALSICQLRMLWTGATCDLAQDTQNLSALRAIADSVTFQPSTTALWFWRGELLNEAIEVRLGEEHEFAFLAPYLRAEGASLKSTKDHILVEVDEIDSAVITVLPEGFGSDIHGVTAPSLEFKKSSLKAMPTFDVWWAASDSQVPNLGGIKDSLRLRLLDESAWNAGRTAVRVKVSEHPSFDRPIDARSLWYRSEVSFELLAQSGKKLMSKNFEVFAAGFGERDARRKVGEKALREFWKLLDAEIRQ